MISENLRNVIENISERLRNVRENISERLRNVSEKTSGRLKNMIAHRPTLIVKRSERRNARRDLARRSENMNTVTTLKRNQCEEKRN